MPELVVETVVAGGDRQARPADGRVVFVRGALPGERVDVRLTEERRDFARAEIVRVITPSPDRVTPPCPFVAAGCGGCAWQHIAPDAQARFKRHIVIDALRRIGRVDDPPVAETIALAPTRYRTTVRVAIDREGRAAFRKHDSHDLVVVDDCLVAHADIAAQLRDRRWPGQREVTLRVADHAEVAGRRYQVSPESFFQIRPDGAAVLVRLVTDALVDHGVTSVVDLYAGVGLFAGAAHDRGIAVRAAVEGNRAAVADARVNLAGVTEVVSADVGRWTGAPVDGVIADPSRKGLGKDGVATVVACLPRVVVLVSCDAPALGRDTQLLAAAGFGLERSQPVDLFPHTPHVEVVSTFVRL
ncbi:MAG TPA: TRAM domain-containing protein [Acidimicrobiales bacterium]|nr:TRAM domain-containing protein [Acidimicrobiales bacterium]